MAKERTPDLMALPPDVRRNLENLQGEVNKAKSSIKTLKKMGMDVSGIEDKLKWAEEIRQTLLTEFK